jgi:predicted negative regulator of RcsB-dependent stress response
MDAEISQSEQWLRFIAWLEDNWRRVAAIASVVIVVGIVVAYFLWSGAEKQRAAAGALSVLLVGTESPTGAALSGFAESNPDTAAAVRAELLAAVAMFTEGNFAEAQTLFENFLAEQGGGALIPKARFGVAACKEAQGQVAAAIGDYTAIVENPSSGNVIPQARFALARLYLEQGQIEMARTQYEELAAAQGSSLAGEARIRLAEMPPSTANRQAEVPLLNPPTTATNQP